MTKNTGERRLAIADQLLALFPPGRVVDLGAGHGLFSKLAADRGWDVTAVDARTERWPADDRIRWIHDDVRNADLGGFDLVLCLGLFYHLTLEDQLALLARCTGMPLILDTHVANSRTRAPLSAPQTVNGYDGRWYDEPDLLRSSWGNKRSFWLTPQSLLTMLSDHGYTTTFGVVPWYRRDRNFWLALPRGFGGGQSPAPTGREDPGPHHARRVDILRTLLAILPRGKAVDLGAGEGLFSLVAGDMGWDVTSVDARSERMLDDPRLEWVHRDAREVDLTPYDVVMCLGLFYHLTVEAQLALLERCRGRPIILDTHVANGKSKSRLSDMVTVDGYEGCWYEEPESPHSSWGDLKSFWPTPQSFLQMLREHGYDTVLASVPWYRPDRTFWLALPRGYQPHDDVGAIAAP